MNPVPERPNRENLALLYQGLLTSIVRVRSGSQPISDCEQFRKRIRDVLVGVHKEAIRFGYREEDIQNTNYAVVAFLDEAILNSTDPSRHQWAALQSEIYDTAVAGESFYEHLRLFSNRRDSVEVADILEVYCLCLLLGYQGRYGGYARERNAEQRQIIDDLQARIDSIRGPSLQLSPGPPPALRAVEEIRSSHGSLRSWKIGAVAAVLGLLLLWTICCLWLTSLTSEIHTSIIS